MSNRFKSLIFAAATALLFSSGAIAQTDQKPKPASPRAAHSFNPHDLSGVWDHAPTNFSGIQGYRGAGPDDPFPALTPWGQAKYDANKPGFGPKLVGGAETNDPITKCDPQGFPRAYTQENPEPMEIIQIPGRILEFVEWNHNWRTIWTDGRELPKDLDPTWYGYAVGKWVGDTLVVTTAGLDDRTWLDPFGDPHSDQMRVEERYRRVDHDTLELSMTIDDPKTYAKPWIMINKRLLKLRTDYELHEAICAPSDEQEFNNAVTVPAAKPGPPK
jgi:hypothetical protein